MSVRDIAGIRLAELAADGSLIGAEADANDLLGQYYGDAVDLIAIPLTRLMPDFFHLSNGKAGAFIQKLVQYQHRVAFVGDVVALAATSKPLNDFIVESNRGRHVWFVADIAELEGRL
jgi:hypothetical protein